ncbi:hypothetical protein NDU88_000888 [Pleurodeles waltl]|uniref:Uncharacterized protein n=1 Tax=Pleurodeles waltl TaxID=8319 RepID=A0AAV7V834_PLEWA|nr:hypothetical protein NDU88_000888 [Pleurodeles waltl]
MSFCCFVKRASDCLSIIQALRRRRTRQRGENSAANQRARLARRKGQNAFLLREEEDAQTGIKSKRSRCTLWCHA